MLLRKNDVLENHMLKSQRLVFDAKIIYHATPASKQHIVDIPSAVYLRTEGKVAECDAIDSLAALVTTASDSSGVFAVLIDIKDEIVNKIYKVSVTPDVGTLVVTASGITTSGRIWLDINSNQSFASTSVKFTIEVDCILA